jgi:hypothetical protein
MGFSNHPPSGLFTNKFLHVSINNKRISINRKEAYTVPNSSTKGTNNKIRLSTTKYVEHSQKPQRTFVDAILERHMNKYVSLPT